MKKKRIEKKKAFQDQGPDPTQDLVRVVIVTGRERGGSPAQGQETGEGLARGRGLGIETGRVIRETDPGQDPDLVTGIATSTRRTKAGEAETMRMSCGSSKKSPGDTRNTRGLEAAPDEMRS